MSPNEKIEFITDILKSLYPDTRPLLNYSSCFELLAAVILSAQCTDARVNQITPRLFIDYGTPDKMAQAEYTAIEDIIHSAGFFHSKARHLIGAAQLISLKFDGKVPESMEDLLIIPGIGRKSANVLRCHCFDLPAIIVDTHFGRVVRRIGLTENRDPGKIEADMHKLLKENQWTGFSMRINLHGRYVCKARTPACWECPIQNYCDFSLNPG